MKPTGGKLSFHSAPADLAFDTDALPSACQLSLLLHRDRHVGVRRQAHRVALDVGDEAERDLVVMPFVRTFAAVFFRELDAAAFDAVDCADMNAVGTDNFHMFLDLAGVGHR